MRCAALPLLLLVLASGLAQAHDYWLDPDGDDYLLYRGHRHSGHLGEDLAPYDLAIVTRALCAGAEGAVREVPPSRTYRARIPGPCAAVLVEADSGTWTWSHTHTGTRQAPGTEPKSVTLPTGKVLSYLKLDHARYKTFDPDPAIPESDYADDWLGGLGYGFTPWLSAYVFLPYHSKVDEPGGFDTHGFADVSLFCQIGFKCDEGLRLIPENESLDDLEDWHFTVFGGLTLPTGDADLRDANGGIAPGKSTGFGSPSYSLGLTATLELTPWLTFNQELSYIGFTENT